LEINPLKNFQSAAPLTKSHTFCYVNDYSNQSKKTLNSLQSYVRAIWVKTRKRQKWFWVDIITRWIPDWPLQD